MSWLRLDRWPEVVQTGLLLACALVLPLVSMVLVTVVLVYEDDVASAEAVLELETEHLASELDEFHRARLRELDGLAALPEVVALCGAAEAGRPERVAAVERALVVLAASADSTRFAAVLDAGGRVLASSRAAAAGADLSHRRYVQDARDGPSVSDVFRSLTVAGDALVVAYAGPVAAAPGPTGCVAVVHADATALDQVLGRAQGFTGERSLALVLDAHGVRVAPSGLPGVSFRPTAALPASDLAAMVAEQRFGVDTEALLSSPVDDPLLHARATGADDGGAPFWGHSPALGESALTLTHRLATTDWTVVTRVPASVVLGPARAVAGRQLVVAGVALGGALALGGAFARSRVHRLRRVAVAVAEIEAGRDDARVHDVGHDEIGQLVQTLNRMAAAVAAQRNTLEETVRARTAELLATNAQLSAQRAELEAQWTELNAQADELHRKNAELERASRLKSEFLSNMSHELRTPLNAVIGFADLLLDGEGELLGERQRGFAAAIASAGRHQLALVNDILDLSKIEAGQVRLSVRSVEPAVALARAHDAVSVLAAAAGVRLEVRADSRAPVAVDPARLHQVLLNLLDNAIKFGPPGGVVEAVTHDASGFVVFEVRDRGPGIPESLRPHLFQPFRQGDSSAVKRHPGTGLGLAISARLVGLHGGSIEALSRDGGGAVMRLRLPVASEPAERPADAESTVPTPQVNGGRVLVVDDDPRVAHVLRELLERRGISVVVATTGAQGLAMASSSVPSLAVVDLRLPDTSGVVLVDQLRAAHPSLPLIVLTAADLEADELDALRAAGAHVARKGQVSGAELVAGIEASLGHRAPTAATGPVVLVVDDNGMNRALLRGMLEARGFRVDEAESGEAALSLVRASPPALVLLDLAMPGMSGYDALRTLKSQRSTADIPVVVVTALAMRSDEAAARAAGADAYFSKPVDAVALLGLVAQLTSRSPD